MTDTNWDICFICQVICKDNFHASKDGYKTLAKNIPEFHKKWKLGFHLERICNAILDLLSVLTTSKAVYHHNCSSKYSDSKLKCFNEPSQKAEMYRT